MSNSRSLRTVLRASTAMLGLAAAGLMATPASAVVINNAYTPTQIVDTTNVTGIGQMVIDQKNGYIGLCTASLINPRTVIFAAHCVNENTAETGFTDGKTYGSKFGGLPIGFFFNAVNNQSGNSAIGHWLNGVAGGAKDLTRTAENAYNANYVLYNPISTSIAEYDPITGELVSANNFLQGDIAMAALDTPASKIPTWTLLFSPLTSPTHATIAGYGNNGLGTTGGSGGIDYRRRVAENMISVLGSLDDQDTFLYHSPDGLPQNLYMLDFNDPKFGTAAANAYDFNIFHDKALPKEGITAPGDSGGPLIVDQAYNKQVIAAVLSGGDRFYGAQPSSSYGTTSFYQPLYLYWDWIVANNPYKYVSAKSGDGSWTDPSHWVINIDPNYVSLVDGALSNTLPTTAAQGLPSGSDVNSPKFGQVCYFNDSVCVNIGTGIVSAYSASTSTQTGSTVVRSSDPAQVVFTEADAASDTNAVTPDASLVGDVLKSLLTYEGVVVGQAAEGSAPINGIVIQGAPGSSNFVPNDTDGNPTTGLPARYYDVTLSAAGTTTLSGATVVIDRLTINGANTGLTIAATGALGTLIDTTVYAGTFRVDGTYVSNGDIALLGGLLTGSGKVAAPYTTAVLGAIAPGTIGTTGTLTVQGSVVFSTGSTFLADVSASGSDLLAVSGTVSLGGTAIVSPVSGYIPKWHENKTVISATTITGSFGTVPDTVAGVLYPTLKTVTIGTGGTAYQTEVVSFEAANFSSVLPNMSADQAAIGDLLDKDRAGSYAAISGVYDAVDPLTDAALGASLENLAPDAARALPKLGQLVSDAYTGFLWQYLGGLSPDGEAKVAVQTSALKLAQNSHVGSVEMRNMMANLGGIDNTTGAVSPLPAASIGTMELPKGVGAFLSGQKLDGIVTVGGSGGKADVDGYLIALGVDLPLSTSVRAGISFAIGEAEANLRTQPAVSKTSAKQIVAYGQYTAPEGYFLSGYFGGSIQTVSTHRVVYAGSSSFAVDGHTHGASPLFGVQLGTAFEDVLAATIKPAIGLQYGEQQFTAYSETGSAAALAYGDYRSQDVAFRVGFDAKWAFELHEVVLKPSVHAFSVTSLTGSPDPLKVSFAAAPTTIANFAVAPTSKSWADLGVGLEADVCDNAVLGFHFNANPGRGDSSYQAFGGSLRIKF